MKVEIITTDSRLLFLTSVVGEEARKKIYEWREACVCLCITAMS